MSSTLFTSSWADRDFHAESVPHILSQDLGYFWVLQTRAEWRPRNWLDRLAAWRFLAAAFLLGELDMEDRPITLPLSRFSSGLDTVTLLKLKDSNEIVGVQSTAVLVRPLPDYRDGQVEEWKSKIGDPTARAQELSAMCRLAVTRLNQQDSIFARGLVDILRGEFDSGDAGLAAPAGQERTLTQLQRLDWPKAVVAEINILVRDRQLIPHQVFVPRCSACRRPLTRPRGSEATEVNDGQTVTIACQHTGCGTATSIPLSAFSIWCRDYNSVVLWQRAPEVVRVEGGEPPQPTWDGETVTFAWNPAHTGGDAANVELRLRFPGRQITALKPQEVLHERLLVLGHGTSSSGSAVRAAWLDAVEEPGILRSDQLPERVVVQGLRLRGLNGRIQHVYSREFLELRPDAALGVFPSPDDHGLEWKWYRVFLAGSDLGGLDVKLDRGTPVLPHVSETHEGLASHVEVVSRPSRAGTTFELPATTNPRGPGQTQVAVDFGTTHSLVYFKPTGADRDPHPSSHAVRPSELAESVHWVTGPPGTTGSAALGSFLPPPAQAGFGGDPYVFPSALWQLPDGKMLIRWSDQAPGGDARARTAFKLDQPGQPLASLRSAYLKELCLLSLPAVIRRQRLAGGERIGHVDLGLAFPLALNHSERTEYARLLNDTRTGLERLTGLRFSLPFTVSESQACVDAFGRFNPGDTFLVADMGGGTIDLALFQATAGAPLMHQIGSVRFAGETYIRAMVCTRDDEAEQERAFWELHDDISQRASTVRGLPRPLFEESVRSFVTIALELIRTMILSHRHETQYSGPMNVILVGNGWQLVPASSPQTATLGHVQVFRDSYEDLVSRLGCGDVSLHFTNFLANLPSSKHLVAIGALQNVQHHQAHELESSDQATRMPAGRGFRFRLPGASHDALSLRWFDKVGNAQPRNEFAGNEPSEFQIEIDLQDMPPSEPAWENQLKRAFRVESLAELPHPEIPRLRRYFLDSVTGPPPHRIGKGPLQILMEHAFPKAIGGEGGQQ